MNRNNVLVNGFANENEKRTDWIKKRVFSFMFKHLFYLLFCKVYSIITNSCIFFSK